MDRSQYLAQAIQQMQADPGVVAQPQGLSPQQMQQVAQGRQAWEAQNPGQSYAAHGVQQLGQNIMGAPGRVSSGLQALVQRFGGGGLPTTTAI